MKNGSNPMGFFTNMANKKKEAINNTGLNPNDPLSVDTLGSYTVPVGDPKQMAIAQRMMFDKVKGTGDTSLMDVYKTRMIPGLATMTREEAAAAVDAMKNLRG